MKIEMGNHMARAERGKAVAFSDTGLGGILCCVLRDHQASLVRHYAGKCRIAPWVSGDNGDRRSDEECEPSQDDCGSGTDSWQGR